MCNDLLLSLFIMFSSVAIFTIKHHFFQGLFSSARINDEYSMSHIQLNGCHVFLEVIFSQRQLADCSISFMVFFNRSNVQNVTEKYQTMLWYHIGQRETFRYGTAISSIIIIINRFI